MKKMKKIYFIVSLAVLALFTSCTDFNATNFPGYDDAAKPTNLVTYNYILADGDYSTISKAVLANATNANDSALAKAIGTNKVFRDTAQFSTGIPLLLNTKYIYVDNKSTAMITYNLNVPYDTTKIIAANRLTLQDSDYIAMGKGSNQPGQYKKFSGAIDPNYYLPIWLKLTKQMNITPYIKSGEVRLIRYKYYNGSATVQNYAVFIYDGTNWAAYNAKTAKKAKFVFNDGNWQFVNSEIFLGLVDGIGEFTTVSVSGDQVWAWDSYNYMKMTGYVSGSYFDNEDWLISPAMNLSDRITPWLSFMHVGRYFGDSGSSTDKMRKAITVWVSTKYDGTNFKAEDWTQLTIPDAGYPSGASWTLISSTPISLAAYAKKNNVRIAFKYLSSASDNAAGTWEVKNVLVYEE